MAATVENEGDKTIDMDMVMEVIEEDINDTAHEGDGTKENIETMDSSVNDTIILGTMINDTLIPGTMIDEP